jgi:hypothetical protein
MLRQSDFIQKDTRVLKCYKYLLSRQTIALESKIPTPHTWVVA